MRALYLSEPSPEDLLQAHVDSLKKKEEEEAERLARYAETYEGGQAISSLTTSMTNRGLS